MLLYKLLIAACHTYSTSCIGNVINNVFFFFFIRPNAYHQRHNHAQNTYNFERDGPYNCNYENILFNQVLPYPHDMVHNSSKDHDQRHASVPLLRQNSDIAPTGNDKQYSVKLNVLEREAECMLVPDKLYELQKYVHISDKNDLSQNSINANQK